MADKEYICEFCQHVAIEGNHTCPQPATPWGNEAFDPIPGEPTPEEQLDRENETSAAEYTADDTVPFGRPLNDSDDGN